MACTSETKYGSNKCRLKLYRLFIIIVPLLFNVVSNAQAPRLKAVVDKYKILIGEPVTLNVEANYPSGVYSVQWFTIQDSSAHFEVIERKKADTVRSNGSINIQQSIIITSFDSGLRIMPALQVNFDPLSNDSSIALFTDSFKIQVTYSPADSILPFHDIKNIITIKDEWPLWMKIAAILTAILILYLIYLLTKKRKKKPLQKPVISKLSPVEEALQALTKLEKSELLTAGKAKEFHTSLTDIFKRYVFRKFDKPLDTLTSNELLIAMNDQVISKERLALIANSIRMADAVKFAKFQPAVTESNTSLSNIRQVITDIDHQPLKTKSDN